MLSTQMIGRSQWLKSTHLKIKPSGFMPSLIIFNLHNPIDKLCDMARL